jgi:hypothetical protein
MSHGYIDSINQVNGSRNSESRLVGNGGLLGQASARVEGNSAIWHPDRPSSDAVAISDESHNGALVQAPVSPSGIWNGNVTNAPGMQAGAVYGRTVEGIQPGMQAGAVYC